MLKTNHKQIRFYDTSALLGGAPIEENSYISSIVFDELEHIKTSSQKDERRKVRGPSTCKKAYVRS